ncbi:hypothetical protein GCM10009733_082850 [Nonomuraea maheshkhaliensis]|uniref:Uncharacterized protein n=1 Tax=Nonomuraea maheshkhaliensis TaxID=419590 RepID=A0ABN2GL46_9ACTN
MKSDVAKSFQQDRVGAFTGSWLLPRLPLLHTLGHLLVRQLSFESGYSAASLRERVYARAAEDGGHQYGLLIYTASGDAEGTLGGLARRANPSFSYGFWNRPPGAPLTRCVPSTTVRAMAT